MIIDEIISYTENKKRVNKKDGKTAKHAKGTTIWTIALYDKEGKRTVKAIVKKGEQTRKQFEEILEIIPKVKYVYSDSAIWYQHAEEYLQEKYEKMGLKFREYIDLIPEWICEKNGITNIIEGINNAFRNGVSFLRRRTSGFARSYEMFQVRCNLVANRLNGIIFLQ